MNLTYAITSDPQRHDGVRPFNICGENRDGGS